MAKGNKISKGATIIVVGAAAFSALMAFLSWQFSRELNKPAISLTKYEIKHNRIAKDKLKIDLKFYFKNVGRQTAKISEIRFGEISLKGNVFEQTITKPMLNPINAESIFSFSTSLNKRINSQLTTEELEKSMPSIVGKSAIIVVLNESGKWIRFYLSYHGTKILSQLKVEEYKMIEGKLPDEFKADN